jgi:periplasmic glucans biosynthesis protein
MKRLKGAGRIEAGRAGRAALCCAVWMMLSTARAETNGISSFDALRQRAAQLAKSPYHPATAPALPDALGKLSYDDYQALRFRPEAGPWRSDELRFDVGLMHRGFIFKDPVKIQLLEGGPPRPLAFSPALFDYGQVRLPSPPPDNIDFAGFKLLLHTDRQQKWDEVASFLGASYFRLVGTRQHYGASGRALAINTGEASGEEFPRLVEFWIEKPGKLSDHVQVYGLLDSPSVAGACRFVITPGEQTAAEVEVCLYPRDAGKKFGLAPLTSMFLMGENRTRYISDFRPEVHDSDGLLIATVDGQWFWRPLENPEKKHRITRYSPGQVSGFGLMQRDRDFRSYEDLAGRYELRPSLWVDFLGARPEGAVELVEIPSPNEYNDNIVAYWVPKQPFEVGKETRFQYRISALSTETAAAGLKVAATRINPGQDNRPPRFIIDFSGATLASTAEVPFLKPRATASRGQIKNLVSQLNDVTGGWRVFFDLEGAGKDLTEIRLTLDAGERPASETWIYACQSL